MLLEHGVMEGLGEDVRHIVVGGDVLDADRRLKLRLASAVTGRSAQQMLTQALDDLLMTLPEIDRLAEQLPQGRRTMTKGG